MRFPLLLPTLTAAAIGACGQSLIHDGTGTGGTATGGLGTGGSAPCGAGLQVCGASCVDLTSSSSNCGSCGYACASGEVCSSGSCATTVLGCQISDPPATAEIATFSSDGGIAPWSGLYTFGVSPQPTYTIARGVANVVDTVELGASPEYQGFGIYLNGNAAGTDCLDASGYTGVSFSISGSLTGAGCTLQFAIVDSEHLQTVPGVTDPKAAGPVGSYPPLFSVPSADLTATAVTFMVPFAGTGAPVGGSPVAPIDPHKLVAVQWWMNTPTFSSDGPAECVWNADISNVSFYR